MPRGSRIVLGLNSGTSADGIDVAACEIAGRGLRIRSRLLGHLNRPYAPGLRRRLSLVTAPAATRTEDLCRLDVEVGRAFAAAAAALIRRLALRRVDAIGSHGQTICHLPPQAPGRRNGARRSVAGTMQIGDASVIAHQLGCPVVHHFRQADVAAGGQGAPLVPWTDYILFRHARKNRVVQNIGGIANLTWLPAGRGVEDVLAFDTGPGNMILDELVRHFSRGGRHFDHNGRRAAAGRADLKLLREWMAHPYIRRPPPKSCGREEFGRAFVQKTLRRHARRRLRCEQWLATAVQFSAACMVLGYAWLCDLTRRRYPPMDEIILCGGGAKNATLVRQLARCVVLAEPPVTVTTTDDYGIPAQAKEAVSFAILAAACLDGVPANLPRVTGAKRRVVLGSVCTMEPRP